MRDNPSTFFARTFHPDEANQAFTAGRLLETGRYEYRPDDHHGPTLYYAAAVIQKAAGHNSLATLDGTASSAAGSFLASSRSCWAPLPYLSSSPRISFRKCFSPASP